MIPGWARAERRRQERDGGERGRDRADPQLPGEAAAHRVELGVETVHVGEDPARPFEHALALGRQPFVALRASHDREADLALEAADPRRERRLRDVAGAGGATEVLLADECHEVCEMAQIHPLMIDTIYQSVEPITLTNVVPAAMLSDGDRLQPVARVPGRTKRSTRDAPRPRDD